jgi:hypothetical protein
MFAIGDKQTRNKALEERKSRVLRDLYQRGATPLGFSTVYCISFLRG